MNKATGLIFTELYVVWVSDDGLKRRLTKVKHFLIYLEKGLSQLIMKQTIGESRSVCPCGNNIHLDLILLKDNHISFMSVFSDTV